MKIIDLSGTWRYRTDEEGDYRFGGELLSEGEFTLPGSTCDNQIGTKQVYYEEFSKEALRAPRERYSYLAPLWLQREVEVPHGMETKSVRLFLERVNLASELWIDGAPIARKIVELSAPHCYDLTGKLSAGVHTFTLRIDNRNLLNLDTMASGYSVDTQGYWNGIIGRIELQYEEPCHIEQISVYTDCGGIDVKVVAAAPIYKPWQRMQAVFDLIVTDPSGVRLPKKRVEATVFNSKQVYTMRLDLDEIQVWDEFDPALYTLTVAYTCGDAPTDAKSARFGMRTIETRGREILLNKVPIALRGTINCAIYPRTGYPPMDVAAWRREFETVKQYGLNHVRFHAWCPPESAFEAADELGLYLSVEMPLWLNRDACQLEVGDDPVHRHYFLQEALTISKVYGNHPSFVMFSNGNENMGDFDLLCDITVCTKAYDPRRLYTATTNFDHPLMPCEDYLCASDAAGQMIRIQGFHDEVAENTCLTYDRAVAAIDAPIISFEVGQYCVYPDVSLIEQYTGAMMATNLEAIRRQMEAHHVAHRLREYMAASGDLAVKLYKEDIEAALRTKGFGGFELLSLSDYTGQSTATVGILDAFYESKGLIEPHDFRRFCDSVVPLFLAKRILTNADTLEAKLDLYDFGKVRIENPLFELQLHKCAAGSDGRWAAQELFYECTTTARTVSIPLQSITRSTMLQVTLRVGAHSNTWRIFVFAPSAVQEDVRLIRSPQELQEIQETGGRAIVTKDGFDGVRGSFIPVFWSPVHFPTTKPCGAIIDAAHGALAAFPTEMYPDYQWKRLFETSVCADVSALGDEARMIVENVPNFVENTPTSPLFEVKSGKAELLYCGFDLDGEEPERQALRSSLYAYMQRKA